LLVIGVAGTILLAKLVAVQLPQPSQNAAAPLIAVGPTQHPPVSREASSLWIVPTSADRTTAASSPALRNLQEGLRFYAQEKYELALSRFNAAAAPGSPLRDYGRYYAGVAELRLQRYENARRRFGELKDTKGFLSQAALLGEGEAAQALRDYSAEIKAYERLLSGKPIDAAAIWLSLAAAQSAAGDRARAAEAYLHLYYEFPTNELAEQASGPLGSMAEVQPIDSGNTRYKLELGRGERLFGLRRIGDARASFLRVQPFASGDDRELVALRLAECDYFQAKYAASRDALTPYLAEGARQAEARFFYLMSQRGLKNDASFELLVRSLMSDFPQSSWSEEALNNLATYYILKDEDDQADAVFREMYTKFPKGRYAERAAWKTGWRAYRTGDMKGAAEFFETAAMTFPRSDYRPSYLYWSGRAREAMGDRVTAISRFQVTTADYLNTYYGRVATTELKTLGTAPSAGNLIFVRDLMSKDDEGDYFPPTSDTIRTLLALDLYDPALKELEFARANWGDSPVLQATVAWTNKQKSAGEKGAVQLNLARGAINTMKRAYPQYMTAGGEQLPREMLMVIFPINYWDLIRKYSGQHDLDPYLVAALMAQESTFVADIRSSANAYGLTQLLPSTARSYARKLKIPYSRRLLTDPESNIKIGTAYLADTIKSFGDVHLALASYNAGERAVRKWLAEKRDLSREEFIDDIPYPETQNYVKRILGTAEDYRRLYGPG